jgi:hypothetical protein
MIAIPQEAEASPRSHLVRQNLPTPRGVKSPLSPACRAGDARQSVTVGDPFALNVNQEMEIANMT